MDFVIGFKNIISKNKTFQEKEKEESKLEQEMQQDHGVSWLKNLKLCISCF